MKMNSALWMSWSWNKFPWKELKLALKQVSLSNWLFIYRICILAVFLRVLAYIYCIDFLKKRPELNVPQNSFRRLTDGIRMLRDGVSPYDGDMIHCVRLLTLITSSFNLQKWVLNQYISGKHQRMVLSLIVIILSIMVS